MGEDQTRPEQGTKAGRSPGDGKRPGSSEEAAGGARFGWVRIARWTAAALTLGCLGGMALLRVAADSWDHAVVNVITWLLGGVALLAALVWFSLWRRLPRIVRAAAVLVLLAMLLVLRLTVRIDQVSGELAPSFAWRWSPKADQLLDDVAVRPSGAPVDLRTTTPDDYPQFLGPRRDLSARELPLLRTWSERAPRLLWRQPIGAAWSAFSAVNGFAVTMEQRGENELVVCYEVRTGWARWRQGIEARHATTLGGVGPRSTPTISGGRAYALGATGVLRCLDGADGRLLWRRDLLREIGSDAERELRAVSWGRAASPLVLDSRVIVPLGGPPGGPYVSLAAFDRETGELIWRGGHRQISYSSPVEATIAGVRQILIVNEDWVSGHDPNDGSVLWEYPWPGKSYANANTSQAVPLPGDRVLLSKGYGGGAELLQLHRTEDGEFQVELLWRNRGVLKTKFSNAAVLDGYAYALSDGVLECVDLETGRRMWKSGRYGHGQILRTGDLLLVQSERGEIAMVEASPEGRRELGVFQAIRGKSWNNLCLYGPYLLVRNAEEAACYELPCEASAGRPERGERN